MKKRIVSSVFIAAAIVWTSSAMAYYRDGEKSNAGSGNSSVKSAGCAPATASLTMAFNDVGAFIEQGGSMFQDRNQGVAAYEVPLGSGLKVIYAGALWMGGVDVNGQLRFAGLTYRNRGNDFWPGPLTVEFPGNYDPHAVMGDSDIRDYGSADINEDQCLYYDKFFTIRKAEVIGFIRWWQCENDQGDPVECLEVDPPSDEVKLRIEKWPAHPTEDYWGLQEFYLAPFYDNDPDGVPGGVEPNGTYDPIVDGDYPWYDDILGRDDIECGMDRRISLFGDETHWWVFNDKGNVHGESQGEPIGMEIRAQAFAFATNDEINRMTFYNYEMINRSTRTLEQTYFAQYIDADVGNYLDDYVGCDVSRGLGYCYNGDLTDETANGNLGYGDNPPAIGVDFFEGPYQDADTLDNVGPYYDSILGQNVVPTVAEAIDGKGIVYKGIGIGYSDGIVDNERFGMRLFTYYNNSGGNQGDPTVAPEFYNYMKGFWKDNSPMYYGGDGYGDDLGNGLFSTYMFPDDSDPLFWATAGTDPGFNWSESDIDGAGNSNPVNDRRFVQSAGPFTLKPGAVNNITVGVVYGRGQDGDLLTSVRAMKQADTKAQALFDACFRILDPPNAPKLEIQELENSLVLTLSNPFTSNNYQEGYEQVDEINLAHITDPTVDKSYNFEGYQIFQMINEDAGVGDIGDPTKARLVAQCDIENSVTDLVNFEFDESLGFSIGEIKVEGENEGVRHSFLVTEDQFAQGDRRLINHKRYYYIAIAYAHNEWKKYDPNDPDALDGQKMPYISSRLSFDGSAIKATEAIPHNPMPEADGTNNLAAYGTSPKIRRLDGYGNGGMTLELTEESKAEILANGKMDKPVYDYGAGPINVMVVDPLNVAGGYYEIEFTDYTATNTNGADEASWVLNRYEYENGPLIGSYSSERTIVVGNEQIIAEWGISVFIEQQAYFLPNGTGGNIDKNCEFMSASMTFADSSKRWLTGVPDNSSFSPFNWIRSGIYDPTDPDDCLPNAPDYFNPCNYPDELGVDPARSFDKILGGIIAPHKLTGYQASYQPMVYVPNYNPGTARLRSSISFLPSVDIVITNDKNLWTRCPVIETGRDAALNEGGAEPGELRAATSVNQDGDPEGSTQGMGWFPGYAIDVESGARLYMAFGENSFLAADNGKDMIWNPSDRMVANDGTFVLGGGQPVYIFSYKSAEINGQSTSGFANFDEYDPNVAENDLTNDLYNRYQSIMNGGSAQEKQLLYSGITWVFNPITEEGFNVLDSDVEIKLRVSKEYKDFDASGDAGESPRYSWNMDDIATMTQSQEQLVDALDLINVVPNPYYAYSEYERSRIDTRVKITNLPERCTVKIYSSNGKLVREFKKDSPITSLDWDLNNHKGIAVAGGVYLIHVEVPGAGENGEPGERVLKFFGGMRQIDLYGI